MEGKSPVIFSRRLGLIPLTPEFLQLSLDGDYSGAEQLLGLSIPSDWFQELALIKLRLEQLQIEPAYQPWSLRAIALRGRQIMVGHFGFHKQPGAEYLRGITSTGVEYGYTVYAPFRRQGYAREACEAMMKWAYQEQEISDFVVTIGPENLASIRLAEGLGFEQVGSHIDEEDGLENIYRLDYGERITMTIPTAMAALTGHWQGTNKLWLSPEEPARESASTAEITLTAQGKFATIRYTWADKGQPQDGMIVLGPEMQNNLVKAVWIDSWHMGDEFMLCEGSIESNGTILVNGSYSAPPDPDWGWQIAIEPQAEDSFRLVMTNVSPDGEKMLAVEQQIPLWERIPENPTGRRKI